MELGGGYGPISPAGPQAPALDRSGPAALWRAVSRESPLASDGRPAVTDRKHR